MQEEQATALPEPQKSQAEGQLTKAREELATKKTNWLRQRVI